jgi:hypothetical protein
MTYNKARIRAYNMVAKAVLLGDLPSPASLACASCGIPAEEYHHPNGYEGDAALDVVAMCTACHTSLHGKKRRAEENRAFLLSLGVRL